MLLYTYGHDYPFSVLLYKKTFTENVLLLFYFFLRLSDDSLKHLSKQNKNFFVRNLKCASKIEKF